MTAAVEELEVTVPPDGKSTPTPCTSRTEPLAPFHAWLTQDPGLDDSKFGVQPGAAPASERLKESEEMHVPVGDAVTVRLRYSLLNTALSVAATLDVSREKKKTQRLRIVAAFSSNAQCHNRG
jgi:hypothetical protein